VPVSINTIKVGECYAVGSRVRKVLKIAVKDGVRRVQYRSRGQKAVKWTPLGGPLGPGS